MVKLRENLVPVFILVAIFLTKLEASEGDTHHERRLLRFLKTKIPTYSAPLMIKDNRGILTSL